MGRNALLQSGRRCLFSSSWSAALSKQTLRPTSFESPSSSSSSLCYLLRVPTTPTFSFSSAVPLRLLHAKSTTYDEDSDVNEQAPDQNEAEVEGETTDGWEEEDEVEPKIGDGGDGGGIVLQDLPWGEQALSIAREILLQFGDDMRLYSFKTSPRGYIYVRLDKLSNKYGCPSMDEIENYSCQYKKKLEEVGELGEIPDDLALEVSSPGAERMLKVPDDLDRFKDMPMRVCYVEEELESKCPEKDGVFLLESIETHMGQCVWKLADVKENKGLLGKGRPLSRKQKDWRLRLPFGLLRRVTLYLEY